MNNFFQWIVKCIRSTFASIVEQIFYYISFFIGFIAWGYFKSITAGIIIGFIAVVSTWIISSFIEGKEK